MIGNAVGVSTNSYRFNIFPEAYLDISSQTIEVSSTISKYLAKRESIDLRGKIMKLNFYMIKLAKFNSSPSKSLSQQMPKSPTKSKESIKLRIQ